MIAAQRNGGEAVCIVMRQQIVKTAAFRKFFLSAAASFAVLIYIILSR